MSITVYTVILGGYDNLRPPRSVEPGVRYVCVADEPQACPPWEVWPAWKPYASHNRNSRIPKILAHLHFDAEYTIYHDGCFILMADPSVLVERLLRDADIAMFRHPCRPSIYEEIRICEREHIGDGPDMTTQVERYRRLGVGQNLWAGGFIARRNTAKVAEFNEAWWGEFINGCTRDQIALPAAQHLTGIKIHTVDADILTDTRILAFCWHAAFKDLGDNERYERERIERGARYERLRQLCR